MAERKYDKVNLAAIGGLEFAFQDSPPYWVASLKRPILALRHNSQTPSKKVSCMEELRYWLSLGSDASAWLVAILSVLPG